MTKAKVVASLKENADPEKAAFYPRFFKTGQGEYGEGDRFLGVTVPHQRRVARKFRELPLKEIAKLLDDRRHECRLTGLLILVEQYERGDDTARAKVAQFYLDKLDRVNNWDLVDLSAHKILGPHLEHSNRKLLDELAATDHLWRQRVAIISTFHYIRQDDFRDTKRIAQSLINHEHDLIHKAVGWMLREMGKRDRGELERFLQRRYKKMPRTMLRYAIEKFPERQRKKYLEGKV